VTGSSVSIRVELSDGACDSEYKFTLSLGDGTKTVFISKPCANFEHTHSYMYNAAGDYIPTVTVTDDILLGETNYFILTNYESLLRSDF
jgi:hypothetical protein